jgi:hypothetical protein
VSQHLSILLFFGGLGTIALLSGILIRAGIWKTWFATKRIPVLLPTSYYFGYIPFGLMLLSIAFASLFEPETRLILFDCLVPLFLVSSIVLSIWQPWWIQPVWYRWLKEHHGNSIPILREEVQAMGGWKWQRRVSTQEGLKQWVAEVRQKHGLD